MSDLTLSATNPDTTTPAVATPPNIQLNADHVLRITPLPWQEQKASYDDPRLPLARALGERIVTFIRSSAAQSGR